MLGDRFHESFLLQCPAFPTAAPVIADQIGHMGLEKTLRQTTLLEDRDGSTAWAEWLAEAGLPNITQLGSLTIPDPNVRVQAVLDGQGIAINDRLIQPEIDAGTLCRISEVEMPNYGYHLAIPADAVSNPDTEALVSWLKASAEGG